MSELATRKHRPYMRWLSGILAAAAGLLLGVWLAAFWQGKCLYIDWWAGQWPTLELQTSDLLPLLLPIQGFPAVGQLLGVEWSVWAVRWVVVVSAWLPGIAGAVLLCVSIGVKAFTTRKRESEGDAV